MLLFAVAAGTVVQGSVGFGFALVVVPVLTFVRPDVLPATVLLLTLPLSVTMAVRERRAVEVVGLVYLLAGRLVGAFVGVGLLLLVSEEYLSVLFGGFVLVAVLTSSLAPEVSLSNRTRVVGGVASGIMGTAAGIGGPPLALIFQSRSGPEIRATLAVAFVFGTTLSLLILALVGRLGHEHLLLALGLLPVLLLGLWAANYMAGLLAGRWLRPAILLFAAVGLAAVLLGLTG
ncbi:MAG TPA: sulfite exporter TauE/SafE family protein [Rubrobacteraceae bacterium]|nr:sulfite exporter TauE/SafE family protein [Rubrobacteraceae bacterium]